MRAATAFFIAVWCTAAYAQEAPQGCDAAHFAALDAYLKQYGNHEPDRLDIERFIALNRRLCDRIIKGAMTEREAGVIYRREVDALADRVSERELELKRQAGLIASG